MLIADNVRNIATSNLLIISEFSQSENMKFFNQEILGPLQEKYEEFKSFVETAPLDLPTEPYKSKYAAFDKLHEINELMKTIQIADVEYQEHIEVIRCHILLNSGTLKS